jgi:hypothetical protein
VNAGAASEAGVVTLGWLSTVAFQKGAVRELTSQCPVKAPHVNSWLTVKKIPNSLMTHAANDIERRKKLR